MKTGFLSGRGRVAFATILLIGFVVAAAPSRAQPTEVYQATQGVEPLALARIGGELGLVGPEGTLEPILLPLMTGLETIEPLAGGWIAAGSRWLDPGLDLYLLRSGGESRQEIAPPAGFRGVSRISPRLVVADGELLGIVWLEGEYQDELAVWAAAWKTTGWGPPELVSAAGRGAQLAPSVTVLADGSWLLVWSAVDGHDDEILWSRRLGAIWSEPATVHPDNGVPDVTPVVSALEGGAIAVWSFLDSDRHFRLLSARFDETGWTVGEPFGYPGSHRPRFFRREGRRALLFRASAPPGWMVIDYDSAGGELRRTFLERSHAGQPVVDFRLPHEVRFLLPEPTAEPPVSEALSRWVPRP